MAENQLPDMVPQEKYLETGAHLGTEFKTGFMRRFIFRIRQDGLKIIDIKSIDDRLRAAATVIAGYDPKDVYLVSRRSYGQKPCEVAAAQIGTKTILGRFMPGMFTNPNGKNFVQPKLLVVTDPLADKQAVAEANRIGIPIVALCTTLNKAKEIDLVVPINNKGKQALALALWSITREILRQKGDIKDYTDFKLEPKDFEFTRIGGKSEFFGGRKFLPKKKAGGRFGDKKPFKRSF